MKKRKILHGGTIVTHDRIFEGDVLIEDDKIKQVGYIKKREILSEQIQSIDVSGKYIFPGMIDAHVHFTSENVTDDVNTGSLSAAFGGITTYIDYIQPAKNESILDSTKNMINKTATDSVIDFSFHLRLVDLNKKIEKELNEVKELGIQNLKIYAAFDDRFPKSKYLDIIKISDKLKLLLTIHAEDEDYIEKIKQKYIAKGKTDIKSFIKTRPPEAEVLTIKEICTALTKYSVPVYFVHLSSNQGFETVERYRKKGCKILCETRPEYLIFSLKKMSKTELKKYLMIPPFRTPKDNKQLWNAVSHNKIQVIASDHYTKHIKDKLSMVDVFKQPIIGLPGVETLLPTIHHFGVKKGLISYNQLVELLSTNPAKIFGIYPEKGSLEPGTDADIVIFDPEKEVRLSHELLHTKAGFSPYETVIVKGYPIMTFLRGEMITRENKFYGTKGTGNFIRAGKSIAFK